MVSEAKEKGKKRIKTTSREDRSKEGNPGELRETQGKPRETQGKPRGNTGELLTVCGSALLHLRSVSDLITE